MPNNTIINGAIWLITASSPQINFQLNVPQTNFEPEQEIQFSIQEPAIEGNYTITLYNSLGFPISTQFLQIPGSINLFSYPLSTNPQEGIYNAYVFWNNATDAGMQTYEFQIIVPFKIPREVLSGIIISSIAILLGAISSFLLIKKASIMKAFYSNIYYTLVNLF